MQTPSQVDALVRARALARWEGEGGALAPSAEADSIEDASLRVLARLGAALSCTDPTHDFHAWFERTTSE